MTGTNSPAASVAIDVQDLVKTYPPKKRALDGLSFQVKAGSIFALLGPNGAGKSTTIKILTTLTTADSGTANVAGFDVSRDPARVRLSIGCVAQRSGVDVQGTGRENLTLQGRLYGLSGTALKDRVAELLKRFSLSEVADRFARTYSGGMQRKLDVAMGLVHRPHILFLDEPTTGLDPEARSNLWDEITRLAQDGLTLLLTTHYLEEADRLAGRVAIVDRGKIVAHGTPEQLKGELRGDSVQIETAEAYPDHLVREALGRVPELREIQLDGKALHARAAQGATAVPLMLNALDAGGIKVAAVKVARPSLDDVYLRHTGRTFEQAEQGTAR